MDYRIDDEAAALRATLREFLEARMPDPAAELDKSARAAAWRELASSGWLEHFATATSATCTPADWVAGVHVAEAFGAVPVPGPVDVVAGYLIPLAGASGMPGLLERVRAGQLITAPSAVSVTSGSDGAVRWMRRRLSAVREPQGLWVSGVLSQVPAAADAQAIVVPIDLDGRPGLAIVECDQAGVEVGESTGVDLRRPVADIRLHRTSLAADSVHTDPGLPTHEQRCAILYSLFLDAEGVGGGAEVIARSVDYCTTRTQFGRPVGAFQAIRHRLADAAAGVEGARSLVYRAAWDVATGAPGAGLDVLASRLWASAAYLAAVESAIQCHGGMGFTWDQRLHLWYRAAVAGRGTGNVAQTRSGLAELLRRDIHPVPSAPHDALAATGRKSK